MIDILSNAILQGIDPHFYDYSEIFTPLQAIKLWTGAITCKNSKAYHFIVTSSCNAVLKDLIHLAMQYQDIIAAYIACIAYNHRISTIVPILEYQFKLNPSRGLSLACKCINYVEDARNRARKNRRGLFYEVNKQRANTYLSTIVFGVYARILWRRFLERILRPESRYVQKINKRFSRSIENGSVTINE